MALSFVRFWKRIGKKSEAVHAKQIGTLRMWRISLVVLLAVFALTEGKTIYVDDDANGLNNGTSWQNAYKFLQDALADANASEKPVEIRVAQGVYKPDQGANQTSGDRAASFWLINGVTLKGGYAGFGEPDPNVRDIEKYETILSGDLAGNDVDVNDPCDLVREPNRAENSFHVMNGSRTNATAIMDGFTITDGNAFDRPSFPPPAPPNLKNKGGGMYIESGSPALFNCSFLKNSAYEGGGGIYNMLVGSNPRMVDCKFVANYDSGIGNSRGSPTIVNCLLSENSDGGGIDSYGGNPQLLGCTFIENRGRTPAGGMVISGEGRQITSCPIINNCIFTRNVGVHAGGIALFYYSSPVITNCTFIGNRGEKAGAVYTSISSPTLAGCVFSGNTGDNGGGIYNNMRDTIVSSSVFTGNSATMGGAICCDDKGNIAVKKCTFAGNSATDGNALACNSYRGTWPGKDEISNSIFWDGAGGIWNNDGSEITVRYSNIQGGKNGVYDPCNGVVWGEGNINVDPCFADANNQDFHLKSQAGRYDANEERWTRDEVTSPCIDAGNPASPIGLEPFPNGGIINMGAYGGTAEASKSYFGEPVCETIVAGDINGDCRVDFEDLALMALYWLGRGGEATPPEPRPRGR